MIKFTSLQRMHRGFTIYIWINAMLHVNILGGKSHEDLTDVENDSNKVLHLLNQNSGKD